jgi:hypothetical protein
MYNKLNKFEEEFKTIYKEHIDILKKQREYTIEATRLLNIVADKNDFILTASQFSTLSFECLFGISEALEKGYFAQCEVLVRWYLELCHIYRYLWQNPQEFVKWQSGKRIRPKDVGKFFEKMGLESAKETYEALSNAVHGNDGFINYYYSRSFSSPKNEFQIIFLGKLLVNLMFIAQKFNYVSYQILIPYIGNDTKILISQYESLEEDILKLTKEFNKIETAYINSINTDH